MSCEHDELERIYDNIYPPKEGRRTKYYECKECEKRFEAKPIK